MSEEEAKRALQSLFDRTQPLQMVRRGMLGDSNGTVMVASRPGWAYIRYREGQLSIVRYLIPEQLPDGTPVVVGKRHPGDAYEQVLGVDWVMYATAPTEAEVGQHATPAIDLNDLSPGRVVPTDPASLAVDVRAFLYVNGDSAVEFGGAALDLTASVPGAPGHRYVLVYMDLDADVLDAENGDIVALGADASAPDVPENGLPLAIVDLEQAQATITEDDIWQYKAMYDSVGTSDVVLVIVHDTVANIQALSPTRHTLAYGTDTPSLWITDASYDMQLVPDLSLAVVDDGDVVTNNGEIVWAI